MLLMELSSNMEIWSVGKKLAVKYTMTLKEVAFILFKKTKQWL